MSMNKIDGSQLNPSQQLDAFKGTARSNKADSGLDSKAGSVSSDNPAKTGDTVEISDKARKLMEMRQAYDTGLESLSKVPDTRADKLEQVRARLKEGFYNSSEVQQKVAEGLLNTFDEIEKL